MAKSPKRVAKPPKRKRVGPGPKCFYCRKNVDGEDYCYGCGIYVCEACDAPWPLQDLASGPGHAKELHLLRIVMALPKGLLDG